VAVPRQPLPTNPSLLLDRQIDYRLPCVTQTFVISP
jgi:hypothetical protein